MPVLRNLSGNQLVADRVEVPISKTSIVKTMWINAARNRITKCATTIDDFRRRPIRISLDNVP